MPSTFGWLDADSEHRRRMLEVVDLFKEPGTLDELGIGAIRDALSDALFPGTSTIHTRLRYVLFVPWLLRRAAHQPTPGEMGTEFRSLEYRMITSLLAGGEKLGVIGNTARTALKRMPSGVYWGALDAWGISRAGFSTDGFFRRQYDYRQLTRRTAATDDPEARELLPGDGLDPHLLPPPDDLLRAATFDLSDEEEQYLSDAIATSAAGSMLSWLVLHQPATMPDFVWDIDNLHDTPAPLAELVDHARRFSVAIHGANILYNLVLARQARRDDLVARYEDLIEQWRGELHRTGVLDGWSRSAWWAAIHRQNPRLRPITRQFVDRWLDLIGTHDDIAANREAATLIGTRERQIKGGRARTVNQSALDRWGGDSGLGRHDFRWVVARRHLQDLYRARDAA